MTRKSATLFCLALWALVPGCQQLSSRGSAVAEAPTKIHDAPPAQAVNPPDPPPTTVVKMPQPPSNEAGPVPIPPLTTVALLPVEGEGKPPRPSGGTPGVVTFEKEPAPEGSVAATYQVLPPLGAKKLSALVRAIDHLQNDRHAEAIQALKEYDEPTQEFLLRIFPVLVQIAKTSIKDLSPQEIANLNDQLLGVLYQLRTRSELLVAKMLYCKEINGFANYVPLPEDHAFLARTDNRFGELVQLYVELKNFASVKTKDGDYLTKLTCSLEVNDKNDKKVWSYTFDKNETTHRRSACVNDYHGNYSFYVPALPEGTYRLTIQIVDETIPEHRRVARKSLVFRVTPVADPLSSR